MSALEATGLIQRDPRDMTRQLIAGEWKRIMEVTAIERSWWPIDSKFLNNQAEKRALDRGELVVASREGRGWRLIGRLNGKEGGEPNTIRPKALKLLNTIIEEWQETLGEEAKVFAAVTSLYRSLGDQEKMDKALSAKSLDSSHLAGAAVDISLRSYYEKNSDGFESVASWGEKKDKYRGENIAGLVEIAKKHMETGECNVVVENRVDGRKLEPTVLHICVSPDFGKE